MPKIAVIIPIYNVEPYISCALDSVLNQTFSDFEIICVDDCSTDGSLNVVKEYMKKDNRIKLIEQKINQGEVVAKYAGASITEADYIATLDPDDYYSPKMLETLYNEAIKNKSDVVCCNIQHVKENGQIKNKILKVTNRTKTINFSEKYINKINPGTPNKIIKKEIFLNSLNFTERDLWKDFYQYWRGYTVSGPTVTLVNKPLYYYRKRTSSITHTKKTAGYFDTSLIKTADYILKYLIENQKYDSYKNAFWFTMTNRMHKTYKNKSMYKQALNEIYDIAQKYSVPQKDIKILKTNYIIFELKKLKEKYL